MCDAVKNSLSFKMNPSYTNDPKRPDVIVAINKPLTADLFLTYVGQ